MSHFSLEWLYLIYLCIHHLVHTRRSPVERNNSHPSKDKFWLKLTRVKSLLAPREITWIPLPLHTWQPNGYVPFLYIFRLNCYLHNKNNVQHQNTHTHFSSLKLLEFVSEELVWLNLILELSQMILWDLPVLPNGLQYPSAVSSSRLCSRPKDRRYKWTEIERTLSMFM